MASAPHAAESSADDPDSAAGRLLQALAIPPGPGFVSHGARVEHLLAPRDGPLLQLVTEGLQLPQGAAELLLRFGAIHTCPVPPALPPAVLDGMGAEEAARVQGVRQQALARAGNSSQARTPQRAVEDAAVPRHSYIRVHLHPKRFPAAYSVNWASRLVAVGEEWAVVSKPAGVPAAATVDNVLECAPACAARALGAAQPLLITHRLDQCTEGLLVLGRARAFVARFNELVSRSGAQAGAGGVSDSGGAGSSGGSSGDSQESGRGGAPDAGGAAPAGEGVSEAADAKPLRKFYRAATSAPPPLGLLRHHLSVGRRRAGLPFFTVAHDEPVTGSQPAELRVLSVQPIRLGTAAAQLWGGGGGEAFECELELLTGRTHQIRAQLSAAGCPLLGDSLYQPLASRQLRERLFAGEPCADPGAPGGRLLHEPDGGIGLQACRLLVADACMGGSAAAPAEFEAGAPWWHA